MPSLAMFEVGGPTHGLNISALSASTPLTVLAVFAPPDGKATSDRCSPETTALTMNIIDEWVRQTEHKYVDGLEKA